jgi:exopolysaccharide biosynthesis polyprenyl glycosylphosphotransferase
VAGAVAGTIWVFASNAIYLKLYPPKKMLIIYGKYKPDDFIEKLAKRSDKYAVNKVMNVEVGEKEIKKNIRDYEAVIVWDLPAQIRNEYLKYCFAHSIRCYVTPKLSDIIIQGAERIHLFDTPLLLSRNIVMTAEEAFVKRLMDIVIALLGIIITSPLMLISAIAIKAYDRGPILYHQERTTIGGKPFMIHKFRSMTMNSEKNGATLASKNDSRITPVGKVLRNTHLDELPQLFNIIAGDMSMVGPRPERREFIREYSKIIPEFPYRLKAKAGLTGYAQVFGKYNTTPYDKLKLDLFYIENYSLLLDVKLMFMTFKIVFQKETSEGVNDGQRSALVESTTEEISEESKR